MHTVQNSDRNRELEIIVHNHPSGDPEPSDEDILQTRRLGMCGVTVDIDVVDYVIIGFSEHVSMKERKLL